MLGGNDGVLVFVGDAGLVREGFSEPVGWADEGCLGIDILFNKVSRTERKVTGEISYIGSLLLACAKRTLVEGSRTHIACCRVRRIIGVCGGISRRIVVEDFSYIVIREKRECPSEKSDKVVLCNYVLRNKKTSFVGVIL